MTRHFETSQWVPFPVELVFAFLANPQNLVHLMPEQLKLRVEDVRFTPPPPRPVAADPGRRFQSVAAGKGSEILVSLTAIPWFPRVSWTARIVEFDWHSSFTEDHVRGPFSAFRYRHDFAPEVRDEVEGTLVTDTMDGALPSDILAAFPAGRVWRKLEESFPYRKQRLPEVLAAASRQAARRA